MVPKRNRPNIAFTLVEILTVVVILAITAFIIVPYAAGGADFQANSAATMLTCDLQYAQNLSISSQTPTTVTFDPNHVTYTLSNASGTLIQPMTNAAYTVNFSTQRGFGEVKIVSAVFGNGKTVTFDITGAPDNPGTVTLQAGANIYRVNVAAATGSVTVTH